MRKLLLGTTALAAAATLSANAALADVSISGMIEWSYDSRSSNVAANNGTSFGQDSDMQIKFSNKTDSGLTVDMLVDFDTDSTTDNDHFTNDETSLSISGGFGKVVLGKDDNAADAYIIDESDLIAEDQAPGVSSMTIDTGTSLVMGSADGNKISYHLPAMGGLTFGISQADGGKATTSSDTVSYGANYALDAGGASITLGYTAATTENTTQDIDSENMGIKVVSGDISLIVSQSGYEASDEDRQAMGASISYALPNGMKVGAYTVKGDDDLDVNEEYSRSGVEVQYTIASGLTAYINVDDYDYKEGTSDGTTASHINDSGTATKLTIKATF
jgi:outer membrane protein OmpU